MYEALPEGFDAKQLQTQHPNSNVEVMVDFLANRCAASLGLSKVFADGNPSNADFRANQLFTWPTIQEFQHSLELVCDWCFNRWMAWATSKKLVKAYIVEDFMEYVDWEWRGMDDLNEVQHQQAIEMKLRNMTSTLKDELGNGWKDKLAQFKYEIDYCKQNGLPHPSFNMISGGERHEAFDDASINENTEVNES